MHRCGCHPLLTMRLSSSTTRSILSPHPHLTAGYNEALGARELRRAVTRLVDDALSDALLRGEVRGRLDWQGCKAQLVRLFIFWPCRQPRS